MLRITFFGITMLFIVLAVAQSLEDASSVTGKDIYRQHCASCHGADRSGAGEMYPPLKNLEDRFSRTQVLDRINNGKGRMPSFSHLTEEEKGALIAFLFDETQEDVVLSTEISGERIFRSNCASCHRATVDAPRPTEARMMEPAPLAGAAKRFTKDQFFNILETGPCYMPSFNHFTSEEKEALYSFVQSLQGKGESSPPTMGKRCPMMMRMRR